MNALLAVGATQAVSVASGPEGKFGKARELVLAFRGRSSITKLDACTTQLCVSLVDPAKVDQARLHAVAAAGVVSDHCLQAIFGPLSENLKTGMDGYLMQAGSDADVGPPPTASAPVAPLALPSAAAVAAPREIEPWVTDAAAPLLAALGGPGEEGRLGLHRSHRA